MPEAEFGLTGDDVNLLRRMKELVFAGQTTPGSAWRPQFIPNPWHFGKLDAQLDSGNTPQNVSVYTWSGSAWVDSTENISAYAPPLLSSGSIAAAKWVRIEFHVQSGRWFVVSAEC